MKTENEKKKHVSADVSLPDMRGEKTEAGDGPKCGGNNWRNIWSLGDRARNGIFSTIIPCATLEVTTSTRRRARAGHHVLARNVFFLWLSFIFFFELRAGAPLHWTRRFHRLRCVHMFCSTEGSSWHDLLVKLQLMLRKSRRGSRGYLLLWSSLGTYAAFRWWRPTFGMKLSFLEAVQDNVAADEQAHIFELVYFDSVHAVMYDSV